ALVRGAYLALARIRARELSFLCELSPGDLAQGRVRDPPRVSAWWFGPPPESWTRRAERLLVWAREERDLAVLPWVWELARTGHVTSRSVFRELTGREEPPLDAEKLALRESKLARRAARALGGE